jgi:hypothetical protein
MIIRRLAWIGLLGAVACGGVSTATARGSGSDASTDASDAAVPGDGASSGDSAPEAAVPDDGASSGDSASEAGDASTICTGVVCKASDQCHLAGTCDPSNGTCSNPPASNSASCNGGTCKDDLSVIGTGDFTIKFTITTTQGGSNVAVLNQRGSCGYSVFWDIRMNAGLLRAETDDGTTTTGYISLDGTVAVNDGAPHVVIVKRVAQVLTITVDGNAAGSGASTASLTSLSALQVGADVCDGLDGTVALTAGTITNICITSP